MINQELQKRILSSIILIPLAVFFIFQEILLFVFFLSFLFLASSYEWVKMNKINFLKIIGLFYLFFAFISAYLLREKFSLGLFILILIICIFTDLGGYIFGKIFKGPKLIKISPKKTYAGSLGGFILSLVAGLIYSKYTLLGGLINLNLSLLTGMGVNKTYLLFILVISLISQIGDLIISYFKRLEEIKDTGKILPGHGGIFDRIDGLMFVVILAFFVQILFINT